MKSKLQTAIIGLLLSTVALAIPRIIQQDGWVNTAGVQWLFPLTDGSANQIIKTDGAGNLSFVTVSAGSSGTVTSVAATVPSILSVTGSPITTTGTLAFALQTQSANTVFAGPVSGGAATPAFRTLVVADIPSGIDAANIGGGAVSNTEYGYLDGVTSAIQTQFSGKQATGSYITSLTGDATASGPGSSAITLANVATPGTATKVTFNAKGLVTSGTTLSSGDIPNNAANTSGNAATATALAANPTDCPGGEFANAIAANGNLTCATPAGGVSSVSGTTPINSSGGATPAISIDVASDSQPGALSAADHAAFAAKFTLPSLTAGSVLFSDGSTTAQNNSNFYWDNSLIRLDIGNPGAPSGDNQARFRNQFTVTDPTGSSVYDNNFNDLRPTFTDDNPANILNTESQLVLSIAAGKTVSGLAFNHYALIGRGDAGDAGNIGQTGGYLASLTHGGNAAKHTGSWAAFEHAFDSIGSDGLIDNVYDFHASAGTPAAGGIGTRWGISLEPDTNYTKQNWLSGTLQLGGASYSAPTTTLNVHGKTYGADAPGDDLDALGAEFHGTANVTVDGSEQAIGVQTSAAITVQSGATDDKEISSLLNTAQRGDGSDEGTLDAISPSVNLLIHNSGAAGVTNKAILSDNVMVLQGGTVGDVYDFRSEVVHAGGTISGNHYGVFLKSDATNPVQHWLSDHASIGGTSHTLAAVDVALQILGGKQFVAATMDTTARDALTAVTGGLIYNTDDQEYQFYNGSAWTSMGGGGGTGFNAITSGTNSTATMVVDTGASLAPTGSGTITANAFDGALPIVNGGTGETSATNAINALVPTQTGNAGKVLSTDSSIVSWIDAGPSIVGTINGVSPSSNGANIVGDTLYMQTAGATSPGLMSAGTQTFAGAKTFNNSITAEVAVLFGDTGGGTNYVTIQAPANADLTADYTLTLPVDDGTSGQVMTTDGSGVLSWTTPTGGLTTNGNNSVYGGTGAGAALTTGANDVFVGVNAGNANTSGGQNTFLGKDAGILNVSGSSLTAVGYSALSKVTVSGNDAFGRSALELLTTGSDNVSVGRNSMATAVGATANVAVGFAALTSTVSGNNNTALGFQAASSSTGSDNVSVGTNTGATLTSGARNVLVGKGSDTGSTTTDAIALGYNAAATANGAIAIGSGVTSSTANRIALGSSSQTVNIAGLTASLPVQTDASKNLVSAAINLSGSQVTSTLPLANGGSNKNMTVVNGGIVWTDTDSMEVTAAGTTGQVLSSAGAAAPTWGAFNQVSNSRASPATYLASTQITMTAAVAMQTRWVQATSGTNQTLGNPQLSAGTVDGQIAILMAGTGSNSLKFTDGNGLSLNGDMEFLADSSLTLMWSSSGSIWIETARVQR